MLKPKQEIDLLLKDARNYIDQAYKIAKENEIYFNPIESLFDADEIEDCGWNSSHC